MDGYVGYCVHNATGDVGEQSQQFECWDIGLLSCLVSQQKPITWYNLVLYMHTHTFSPTEMSNLSLLQR